MARLPGVIFFGSGPSFSGGETVVSRCLQSFRFSNDFTARMREGIFKLRFRPFATAILLLSALMFSGAGIAQEKPLAIELNKTVDAGAGCRLTFVANNDTGAALDKASYEIAVFDSKKQVAKLLIFEFGKLAKGKTKVVEFEFPDIGCAAISRILVNTSPECSVEGQPSTICLDNLATSSLSEIAFDQ